MRSARPLVPVLVAALLALGTADPARGEDTRGLRARATQLLSLDHHAFLAEKAAAPPPFDWSTDGCTATPPTWAATFDGPCQQHDFGYRNLGHGLRLRATNAARAWVDRRLLAELRRVCAERFAALAATRCRIRARAMYVAVRLFNPPWS